MSIVGKSQLGKQGFICLAGPYTKDEEHMIPAVIQDALRVGKEVETEATRNGIYVWHRSKSGR